MKKIILGIVATTVSLAAMGNSAQASNGFQSEGLFDFADKERWIIRARALMVEPDEDASISAIGNWW